MSLKLENLEVAPGSVHEHFRKGIGIGTGNGKTSGRGQKGAGARSGASRNALFAGGQLPMYRAFPKRGFTSLKHDRVVGIVNLSQLSAKFEDNTEIGFVDLVEARLIKPSVDEVKILGKGELTLKNLTVHADSFSKHAREAIEKSGGKAICDEGFPHASEGEVED